MSCGSTISRILLTVFCTLFLLSSIALIIAGAFGLRNPSVADINANGLEINIRPLFIGVLVMGIWLTLSSLAGCFGAITRKNGLLNFFMILLVIDLLAYAACGGYVIWKMRDNQNLVKDFTREQYIELDTPAQLGIQTVFQCCGYTKGDAETTFISEGVDSGTIVVDGKEYEFDNNPCISQDVADTIEGCHQAAQNFWEGSFVLFVVGFAVSMLFMLILLLLAKSSKEKLSSKD